MQNAVPLFASPAVPHVFSAKIKTQRPFYTPNSNDYNVEYPIGSSAFGFVAVVIQKEIDSLFFCVVTPNTDISIPKFLTN